MNLQSFEASLVRRRFLRRRLALYEDYLDSGEDFRGYLEFARELMEGRKDPALPAVDLILTALARGVPVAEALAEVAPPHDVTMLNAWENRGMLNKGMEELISAVREEEELKSMALSQLAGPLFYMVIAILLLTYGIPLLVNSMGPALLNSSTMTVDQRALVSLSNFMSDNSNILNVVYVLAPVAFLVSLTRWAGAARRWADHAFAPYAAYRSYQAALFLRTFGAQLMVTPKMEEALAEIRKNSSRWLRWYIDQMLDKIPFNRVNPVMAMDVGLLDVKTVDSLILVSQRGDSETAIISRSKKASAQAAKTIKTYVKVIDRAGKVLLGITLGWAAFSLMTQTIKQQVQSSQNATVSVQTTVAKP